MWKKIIAVLTMASFLSFSILPAEDMPQSESFSFSSPLLQPDFAQDVKQDDISLKLNLIKDNVLVMDQEFQMYQKWTKFQVNYLESENKMLRDSMKRDKTLIVCLTICCCILTTGITIQAIRSQNEHH